MAFYLFDRLEALEHEVIGVIYRRDDKPSLLHEQAVLRERFAGQGSLEKLFSKFA